MNIKTILEAVIDTLVAAGMAEKNEVNGASRLIDDLNLGYIQLIKLEHLLELYFGVPVNLTEGVQPETIEDVVMHIAKKL